MAEEPHFIDGIGSLLAMLGIDPSAVELNYEKDGSQVMLAIPESKVALATDGDEYESLIEQDWFVTRMDVSAMKAVARGYSVLSSFAVEHLTRASSEAMLKSGSTEEERLLQGILRANIRMPNRNLSLKRPDGTELTVPDFAWEDLKLAFFVDGLWWHVSKDDSETLKKIAKSKKNSQDLLRANKSRAVRDAANRSEMALDGWRILSCTDQDLATNEGVKKQVDNILKMMRQIHKERQNAPVVEQEHSEEEIGDYIPETRPDTRDSGGELFPAADLATPAAVSVATVVAAEDIEPEEDPGEDPDLEDEGDDPDQEFLIDPAPPPAPVPVPADESEIDPLSFF